MQKKNSLINFLTWVGILVILAMVVYFGIGLYKINKYVSQEKALRDNVDNDYEFKNSTSTIDIDEKTENNTEDIIQE